MVVKQQNVDWLFYYHFYFLVISVCYFLSQSVFLFYAESSFAINCSFICEINRSVVIIIYKHTWHKKKSNNINNIVRKSVVDSLVLFCSVSFVWTLGERGTDFILALACFALLFVSFTLFTQENPFSLGRNGWKIVQSYLVVSVGGKKNVSWF